MTVVEVSLIGIVVGVLGFGGGKAFSNSKLCNKINSKLNKEEHEKVCALRLQPLEELRDEWKSFLVAQDKRHKEILEELRRMRNGERRRVNNE